jgi:hypothetical protein
MTAKTRSIDVDASPLGLRRIVNQVERTGKPIPSCRSAAVSDLQRFRSTAPKPGVGLAPVSSSQGLKMKACDIATHAHQGDLGEVAAGDLPFVLGFDDHCGGQPWNAAGLGKVCTTSARLMALIECPQVCSLKCLTCERVSA